MNKNIIIKKAIRKVHMTGLRFRKCSPEILVIAGIIGTIGSTVMACKATTKLSSILEESRKDADDIHQYAETEGFSDKYTEKDMNKDLTIVHAKSAVKVIQLYAPAIGLGTLSIAAILGGHHILRKRNVALAAAYAAVEKSFKDYRGRVAEKFGEAMEKEIRYNISEKEIEEKVVKEDGTETVEKRLVKTVDPNNYSEFARFFDDGCLGWDKDPELNLLTLRKQQEYATDRLRAQGYLFLNDVYEMLGIPKTAAGQLVGWIYNEKHPVGDNYVDFGIYDIEKPRNRDFVNGYERTILLDFNVDGNILDKI